MNDNYILDGKKTIACDLMTWANWFEKANRRVALDEHDGVKVSTVFLGLDDSFGEGKPMLFETMIFGGPHDQDQERYSTWAEAEAGHAKMCKKAFGGKRE